MGIFTPPVNMYINGIAHYLPSRVLGNEHFARTCGITSDWIEERTGIIERRMCSENENTNTMAVQAVQRLNQQFEELPPYDLIIGATYSPYDTVFTLAHALQHHLLIPNIPTLSLSTACSSLLNAFEVAEGYFATGKASRALIIGSEHNTAYFDDTDKVSGPLWGDGAVAFSVSKDSISDCDLSVRYLKTGGAATQGKANSAVFLRPWEGGIGMPNGRDVFINACSFMQNESLELFKKLHLSVHDIDYFIPHQANLRISKHVASELGLPEHKLVLNTHKYGNTGCCGFGIGFSETMPVIRKGNRMLVVVFGGGYSFGAMLVQA